MSRLRSVVPHKIELTDIITPKSCSFFIAELIKYLAYNKQQIPYPYERLKMYVLKRREHQKSLKLTDDGDNSGSSVRVTFLMEKYYKKIEGAFEVLDQIFKCIEQELHEHPVEEVVLLFGATPISPKDVYRIKIPSLSYGHSEEQHLLKRQLGNLFRGIIVSDEVNTNIHHKVGLTNMFVMIKVRRSGSSGNSEWFLPKDHYRLSERAHQVCFSFTSLPSKPCTCFTADSLMEVLPEDMDSLCISNSVAGDEVRTVIEESLWYQAPRSLKGFRDCKTQGKSITDLWYKYRFLS